MLPTYAQRYCNEGRFTGNRLPKGDHDSQTHPYTLTRSAAACNRNLSWGEQPDPVKDELANAAPVELPPAIASTKTYRWDNTWSD
jgi:hypothetical protein